MLDSGLTKSVEFISGCELESWRNKNGRLSRTGAPALVVITNSKRVESYYENGKLNRPEGLPAIVTPETLAWYMNGKLMMTYNIDLEEFAIAELFSLGFTAIVSVGAKIQTHVDNKPHSLAGFPSEIDMIAKTRKWHVNGVQFRAGGLPSFVSEDAVEFTDKNGKTIRVDSIQ